MANKKSDYALINALAENKKISSTYTPKNQTNKAREMLQSLFEGLTNTVKDTLSKPTIGGGSHSFGTSTKSNIGGGSHSFGANTNIGGGSASFDPADHSALDRLVDKYSLSDENVSAIKKGIKYNASKASDAFTNDIIPEVKSMLQKAGIYVKDTGSKVYDAAMERAVKAFQKMKGLKEDGVLNEETLQALSDEANKNSPDNVSDKMDPLGDELDENPNEGNPHYTTYFDENNDKTFRQNVNDIKIVLGQGSITKTIKDVYMRSQTTEFDTSGNPISEVYEFIARDIVESDETKDEGKYDGEERYAPSDIKHIFNYK